MSNLTNPPGGGEPPIAIGM